MTQCCHGKERCRPTAQPHRWRDVRDEGIAPAQQQVDGRQEGHDTRYAIKDEKENDFSGYRFSKHGFNYLEWIDIVIDLQGAVTLVLQHLLLGER